MTDNRKADTVTFTVECVVTIVVDLNAGNKVKTELGEITLSDAEIALYAEGEFLEEFSPGDTIPEIDSKGVSKAVAWANSYLNQYVR